MSIPTFQFIEVDFFKFILSIFCCIGSLLLRGLSLVAVSRGYSSLQCAGFSLRWLFFSSCGTRAQLLRGMWGLPEPGLEPVSPALAGGFLTPAPPGKSLLRLILKEVWSSLASRQIPCCVGIF